MAMEKERRHFLTSRNNAQFVLGVMKNKKVRQLWSGQKSGAPE